MWKIGLWANTLKKKPMVFNSACIPLCCVIFIPLFHYLPPCWTHGCFNHSHCIPASSWKWSSFFHPWWGTHESKIQNMAFSSYMIWTKLCTYERIWTGVLDCALHSHHLDTIWGRLVFVPLVPHTSFWVEMYIFPSIYLIVVSLPSPSHLSLPDQLPSFSSSSCPSSQSSLRRGSWRRKAGRPALLNPPAGRGMSRRPNGTTGSSGCKHSSPQSGDTIRGDAVS